MYTLYNYPNGQQQRKYEEAPWIGGLRGMVRTEAGDVEATAMPFHTEIIGQKHSECEWMQISENKAENTIYKCHQFFGLLLLYVA